MVLLGYRSLAAKQGLGSTLIDHLTPNIFSSATLIALLLVAAILHGVGIAMMVWVARLHYSEQESIFTAGWAA